MNLEELYQKIFTSYQQTAKQFTPELNGKKNQKNDFASIKSKNAHAKVHSMPQNFLMKDQIRSIEVRRGQEMLVCLSEDNLNPEFSVAEWVDEGDLHEEVLSHFEPKSYNEIDEICLILSWVVDWISNPWINDC